MRVEAPESFEPGDPAAGEQPGLCGARGSAVMLNGLAQPRLGSPLNAGGVGFELGVLGVSGLARDARCCCRPCFAMLLVSAPEQRASTPLTTL